MAKDMRENQLVSVVIPTYNCGKYISEAIDSVLNQTYKNLEIIIVDDGSTDNTRDVLDRYKNKIRYFYQNNSGGTGARNRGIKEAKGDCVAFFDADDLWKEEKLEKSLKFLVKNKFDWICTGLKKVTMEGELLEERTMDKSRYGYNSETGELYDLKKGLFSQSFSLPIHTNTQVMRKQCFQKAGLLDESLLICENTELCIRFEEAGLRGGYLNEMLTIYRTHKESITKSNKFDGLRYEHIVAKRYAKKTGFHKMKVRNDYANFLWELGSRYYSKRCWPKIIKYSLLSLLYAPSLSKIIKIKRYLLNKAVKQNGKD